MDRNDLPSRLSQIKTLWSDLTRAHRGEPGEAAGARQDLVQRYYGAAYRYLGGVLRKTCADGRTDVDEVAWELTHEFATRFLRGDFRRADPGRGRFRDFLKQALRNLVVDHWRRQGKDPAGLDPERDAASDPAFDPDRVFLDSWREEVFRQAWEALEGVERGGGPPYHTVLRCHLEQPELSAVDMAARLGPRLGRNFTEEGMRQMLRRARVKFADLLVDEVAHSLQTTDLERVREEVIELGLLPYCKEALQRRQPNP
jgi:DNA-directed RNA polymerase specialized sigma24 family protein